MKHLRPGGKKYLSISAADFIFINYLIEVGANELIKVAVSQSPRVGYKQLFGIDVDLNLVTHVFINSASPL
ncbi:hypothetical protein JW887_05970, partial [Candidatus Dojkabacteria bacterium]|nr:hypothetical protein [Candidatus Dojkabacteria bacterium]